MFSVLQETDSITVAGRKFKDLTNLKILTASISAGAASYSVFYNASIGATRAVYQVPVGKSFQLHAYQIKRSTATGATAQGGGFFYGDTSLGSNAAGPLTNPRGLITGAANVTTEGDLFLTDLWGTTNPNFEACHGGTAAAQKYIHVYCNAGIGGFFAILYGYEI